MFRRIIQPGLVCILDADQESPLKFWDKKNRHGQIKRSKSDDAKGLALEINSKIPLSSYISCPANNNQILAIQYPYFHMIVKIPSSTSFTFDIQVVDDKFVRRRFRVSTTQTFAEIHSFMCKLPLTMESGWNHITIPLHQVVKDIYGTSYVQTLRLAVYSNCLLKKIYFSDKEYSEEDLPAKFHIEEFDPTETYRLKFATVASTRKRSSLSYYQDLIGPNGKRINITSYSNIG